MRYFLSILLISSICTLTFADVSAFHSYASSTIVQYKSGAEVQRQNYAKGYPEAQASTPVEVTGNLSGNNSNGLPLWKAFNRVVSNDPQYNSSIPCDFIMESAIGSADNDVKLSVESIASQTRKINILASEFPDKSEGDAVRLRSNFVLDGAMAAVVPVTAGSAEGLQVKLSLDIKQDDNTLWNGSVTMSGKDDGDVSITSDGDFFDNDFSVIPINVPDLGKVWLINFDDTVLKYEYSTTVGATFDLTANLKMEYAVPGGLGAGSAFGTVPTELIMLSNELFEQSSVTAAKAGIAAIPAPEPISLLVMLTGLAISIRKRRL